MQRKMQEATRGGHLEGQEEGGAVEFGGVVGEDVFALKVGVGEGLMHVTHHRSHITRHTSHVTRHTSYNSNHTARTCSNVMKSPPGKYSNAKYKLSRS